MRLAINWRVGILSAIVVAVVGIGFFVFIGSQLDYSCKNAMPASIGCRVYDSVSAVINGYADVFRSVFAPRCVGGNGPDDCLGPDTMIMLVTLLVIGFVAGNLVWRKKTKLGARP